MRPQASSSGQYGQIFDPKGLLTQDKSQFTDSIEKEIIVLNQHQHDVSHVLMRKLENPSTIFIDGGKHNYYKTQSNKVNSKYKSSPPY